MKKSIHIAIATVMLLGLFPAASAADAKKKIVLLAGAPSHGPGDHEHNAGVLLLKKCLEAVPDVEVTSHQNGWPQDAQAFDGADTVLIYSDGGGGHPMIQAERLQQMREVMKRGAGLVCLHYAVEVPKEKGGPEMLQWLGGYFEAFWSVNPHWDADFKELPKHPITSGVKPFEINDEWYYHMRFPEGMKGVTPILTAVPPESTRQGKDSSHGGNPHVRARTGQPEHVAWAFERPDGGRAFGFTGGHKHKNWGDDNFRKLVLNAILWTAKAKVPAEGVQSTITDEDLKKNLDPKEAPKAASKGADGPARPVVSAKAAFQSPLVKDQIAIDVELKGAKDLWLVVTDGGDGYRADWANWAEPELVKADGSKMKLTELKWKSATAGWGTVGLNKNADGKPMRIGGKPVNNGIGTHAPSLIQYELPEGITRFRAIGGLDNGGTDQGAGSTVQFHVFTQQPDEKIFGASNPGGGGASENRPSGAEAAEEALKAMTIAEGLEATVFASEPMVVNPTDMDIDARGRVWITEGANYRYTIKPWGILRPEGDRIVILEDTNGDGKADSAKTFYQGQDINSALGICVLGNKVIVSRSPDIFVFTDTDGDDKADKKEVLFTGIKGVDHDHGVHAFVFGPDGKLYFNFGNAGEVLKRADGSVALDIEGNGIEAKGKPFRQGMVFRCNVDGSEIEVLGHNFRNNYEVAVDSFGTLWQSDNDDDGNKGVRINYVMERGNFGFTDEMTGAGWNAPRTNMETEIPRKHWYQNDPGVIPNLLVTGAGSPTGILVYEGTLLPAVFRNQIIHCDAGPSVVRAYPVTSRGAGYAAEIVDFVKSNDSWFRPSDACVAPDGSVYIADWNDPGVGGHDMGERDLSAMRGRVYRVAPRAMKTVVPKVDLTTAAGAVQALQSPNQATRYLAWTKLQEGQNDAEKELAALAKSDNPRLRSRAFHLLARLKGQEKKYVELAVRDPDADVRIAALRIARGMKLDVIPFVQLLANDPSAAVRRECAISLRGSESPEAPKLWSALAQQHDGKDKWYLEALGIGAQKQETRFFAAWLQAVGDKWNTPAGRDIVWRSRGTNVPVYLVKIISDPQTTEQDRPRYVRALDFITGPEKEAALLDLVAASIK